MTDGMQNRSLSMLEFGKVLEHLAEYAVSDAGREACLAIFPQSSLSEIEKQTKLFNETRLWQQHSNFKLSNFPDLAGVISFLSRSGEFLDMDALWAVRAVLMQAREVEETLLASSKNFGSIKADDYWPLLKSLFLSYPMPHSTISALIRCISDDGLLNDQSSPELALIRGEVRAIHQQCTRKVKEFAKNNNITQYLQEEFMTLSSDRYVLPFKSSFKGQLDGIIHDYSQTGETCYFEPFFLVTLNNKLQELKKEEREEERKVLRYISGIIRSEEPALRAAYNFLVELDILLAKIALAGKYDGRMLSFIEDGEVYLKNAMHPLLVLMYDSVPGQCDSNSNSTSKKGPAKKQGSQVVPVDIELPKGQRALIISGGNAGGKTVSLKTLGLIALMGLAAIPVPVGPGSTLPLWKHVFAFIGDEQSLDEHVSTYTAQIEHLAEIWELVGKDSLVILDEFGAGTDPSQGSALAQAVVDEILQAGGYVLAATHFPAFKAYALSRSDVRAASVLFDSNNKKPLYTLVYDQVGASLALDVARAHGLPAQIIKQAEKYLLVEDKEASDLIDRLNGLAVEREKEIAKLKQTEAELDAKKQKLNERFEKERLKLLQQLDQTRREVVAQIKAEQIGRKQALKEFSTIKEKLAAEAPASQSIMSEEQSLELFASLVPGAQATYIPWGRKGIIEDVDAKKQRAKLDFNGVSIWAAFADLQTGSQAGAANAAGAKQILPSTPKLSGKSFGRAFEGTGKAEKSESTSGASTFVPLQIDFRGQRAEEVILELERLIDQAILSGREELEIVHGRGTGALRREIHNFLRYQPGVANFYTANEDQGGDGVTIVELK